MIYFICTSMFHTLISLLLVNTIYKDTIEKKILVLPNHVDSIMKYKDNFEASGTWDEVRIIKTKGENLAEIQKQAKAFFLTKHDIVHGFGFEAFTLFLLKSVPARGTWVFTAEGGVTPSIEKCVEILENSVVFQTEFPYEKVSEIWVYNNYSGTNMHNIPVRIIDFKSMLEDSKFLNIIRTKIVQMYNLQDFTLETKGCIFFDQYFSEIKWLSPQTERFYLEQIILSVQPYAFYIKIHPGEPLIRQETKYKGLEKHLLSYSDIPWEALLLANENLFNKNNRQILLSYASSALLGGESFLNQDNNYIIFLNKILARSTFDPEYIDYLQPYLNAHPSKHIYFPETFTELRKIISEINGCKSSEPDWQQLQLEEDFKELEMLRAFQRDNFKLLPGDRNVSTLFFNCGDACEYSQEIDFLIEQPKQEISFLFQTPENCLSKLLQVRWYAVRARKVEIKIDTLMCTLVDGTQIQLSPNEITCFESETNTNGFISLDSFDPAFFITPPADSHKIFIKATFNFDNSYQGAVVLANRMAHNLACRLESSIKDAAMLEEKFNISSLKLDEQLIEIELLKRQANEFEEKIYKLSLQLNDQIIANELLKKQAMEHKEKERKSELDKKKLGLQLQEKNFKLIQMEQRLVNFYDQENVAKLKSAENKLFIKWKRVN